MYAKPHTSTRNQQPITCISYRGNAICHVHGYGGAINGFVAFHWHAIGTTNTGLNNIYEMPELRSTTSRSATRTGSPLTSLPASTPVMGEQETRLHELRHAFYFATPFSQGPYPPCYSEVQESMQELMGMFTEDW